VPDNRTANDLSINRPWHRNFVRLGRAVRRSQLGIGPTMTKAATTTCAHCGNRFERGRRQNQYRRADGARHQGGRYCSDRCRKRASRARLESLSASVTTSARPSVTEPPGTIPHASVTGTIQPIETTEDFSTEKTDLGRSEAPRRSTTRALPSGIVPDAKWPGMYRLVLPDGSLSDMVNLTRAKDAVLNRRGSEG